MTNVEALEELLKIPSISAHHQGIQDCAEHVKEFLQEAGFQARVIPTEGHPVVFGEKKGESEKTLLFYDHYDVQPPDPLDQWVTPPFEPSVRGNRLYARGVADNKGNIMARLAAVERFATLPITIKFIIEGEEEIGSPSLGKFVETHTSLLKADACIWEAGYKDEAGRPTMYLGAKGLCYVELRAYGPKRDLHSASAVIVENPAWRLIRALTTLKDSQEHILIEDFYQDIEAPAEEELGKVNSIPYDGDKTKTILGIDHFLKNMSDEEAVFHLLYGPTCNICGINSGYTGDGSKTVLPAEAMAKIDFRLVPNQDPHRIFQLLNHHLEKHGFTDIKTELLGPLWPAKTPVTARIVSVTEQSMEAVHKRPPVIYPTMSGSGPMWLFTDVLGIPTVSIGVGDAESRAHSPNESISLADYEEGITVIEEIIKRM
ncbi:MAG: M20/M25/M40 family metallo-hydrolase [Theionarchaea archaeon]|nr:M20/M25/M40 family metallo-hydrolase [Theionarchaea archaeon]MBU7038599.1 M20/M25/M40 family metallo-hydrolase [Theionarchaea archaeon]